MQSILKDITVIELSTVLAGPAVGTFFAEMGARVIKVENMSTGGDVTRSWKTKDEKQSVSAYFSSVNHHKEFVDLDLKNAQDLENCKALIKDADIVITNFRDSSAKKLGLDYSSLKNLKEDIILGTIKGFAHSNRPAYDAVLQAETGFMSMNGQANNPPTKMPVALIDVLAAHQLKEGLLLALIQRGQTGKGCYVSASLEETAIASLANQASNYLMNGIVAQRKGSLHPNIAPYGEILDTKDGRQLILAIGNDSQFENLCDILGLKELNEDERFNKNVKRVKNRIVLLEYLQSGSKQMDFDTLYSACMKQNIPVGEIKTLDQVLQSEAAKDLTIKEIIDGSETLRIQSSVFKIGS